MKVRLLNKLKPKSYTESFEVNEAGGKGERMCENPGGGARKRVKVNIIQKNA